MPLTTHRYLLTHDPDCGCHTRQDTACQDPDEIMLHLWGRDARTHTVYDGELPYYFVTADLLCVRHILRVCPATQWAAVVRREGCAVLRDTGGAVLCQIGGTRPGASDLQTPWPGHPSAPAAYGCAGPH